MPLVILTHARLLTMIFFNQNVIIIHLSYLSDGM